VENYKLQISEWHTSTQGIRSSSVEKRRSRTPEYIDGFTEELSNSASTEGGTYTRNFRTRTHSPRTQRFNRDSEADFPADWIQYITDHAWVFNVGAKGVMAVLRSMTVASLPRMLRLRRVPKISAIFHRIELLRAIGQPSREGRQRQSRLDRI
jgi:hypothetical protein